MKLYACVKQVPDTETTIELNDNTSIKQNTIKWIINPLCEHGIEEALRVKEKSLADEVIVVSLGIERVAETLRAALALGADRAIQVVTDQYLDHANVAQALATAITRDHAENEQVLIFTGTTASDDSAGMLHIFLAEQLGYPVVTNVSACELTGTDLLVTRDGDQGAQEKIALTVPAVIAVNRAINTPRYPALMNIMKAKKKEIKTLSLKELGLTDIQNSSEFVDYVAQPDKLFRTLLEGETPDLVSQLITRLKDEVKVL